MKTEGDYIVFTVPDRQFRIRKMAIGYVWLAFCTVIGMVIGAYLGLWIVGRI